MILIVQFDGKSLGFRNIAIWATDAFLHPVSPSLLPCWPLAKGHHMHSLIWMPSELQILLSLRHTLVTRFKFIFATHLYNSVIHLKANLISCGPHYTICFLFLDPCFLKYIQSWKPAWSGNALNLTAAPRLGGSTWEHLSLQLCFCSSFIHFQMMPLPSQLLSEGAVWRNMTANLGIDTEE